MFAKFWDHPATWLGSLLPELATGLSTTGVSFGWSAHRLVFSFFPFQCPLERPLEKGKPTRSGRQSLKGKLESLNVSACKTTDFLFSNRTTLRVIGWCRSSRPAPTPKITIVYGTSPRACRIANAHKRGTMDTLTCKVSVMDCPAIRSRRIGNPLGPTQCLLRRCTTHVVGAHCCEVETQRNVRQTRRQL